MKSYFPEDYCPQREKVLDLSRSVLTGRRRFARQRRNYGRYVAKVERQISRDQLRRAASWLCICDGDVTVDCPRCYNDDLPTISETHTGSRLPMKLGAYDLFEGFADHIGQLMRWCLHRTEDMDHYELEAFLREMFLCSPFGHSVKTRHAFDHLFEEIAIYRAYNYDPPSKFGSSVIQNLRLVHEENSVAA